MGGDGERGVAGVAGHLEEAEEETNMKYWRKSSKWRAAYRRASLINKVRLDAVADHLPMFNRANRVTVMLLRESQRFGRDICNYFLRPGMQGITRRP